jgi:DNA-binding GntR family transcriptional regulator
MMLHAVDADIDSHRIAARISQAIHEHRLAPGTKLSEEEVAGTFDVSRTIVRAALQRLAHDRLVELKRNRGAFVAQPTVREAREVFEARALLEPRTARSAAERAGPADIASLRRHIDEEHAAMADGDAGRALYLSGLFHIEIARIADQATIAAFVSQLIARSSLIIALYWERRRALCESHSHHALLEALKRKDGALAEELMTSHLVDLLASLDLRRQPSGGLSLKDALALSTGRVR